MNDTADSAAKGAGGGALWHLTRDGVPARCGAEGFVHGSYTAQLEGTIDVHFAGATQLVLLRLDPRRLGDRLVVEPSRHGALFPHVYRELLDTDILERLTLQRGADGRFDLSRLPP